MRIPPAAARVTAHRASFRLLPPTHPPSDLQGSSSLLNLQPTLERRRHGLLSAPPEESGAVTCTGLGSAYPWRLQEGTPPEAGVGPAPSGRFRPECYANANV